MCDDRLYVDDLLTIANFLFPSPLDQDYQLKNHYINLLEKMAASMCTDDYIFITDSYFGRFSVKD